LISGGNIPGRDKNIKYPMMVMPQTNTMSPWAQGGLQGGGMLMEALGALFGNQDQKKLLRQKMGRGTDLYNLFRYNSGYGEDVIGPSKQNQMMGQWQQSMGPTFDKFRSGAAGAGNMQSPDIQRMILRAMIAPTAQYSGNLQLKNIFATQQRDSDLRHNMRGLAV
jgi:hypothetical protein